MVARSFRARSLREVAAQGLVRVALGEGFALYAGQLDGEPCVVADGSALRELADDADARLVEVHVFDSELERDAFVRARTVSS
ncbi:MAG: hypothetical protein IT378_14630 [Sandaracinaceae bacterium]|nr:hypothetical protein [Sandaracinaceae bacterium]